MMQIQVSTNNMQAEYQPQTIESAVQQYWADNHTFYVTEDPNKEKFYCLSMCPYPSGDLHMGHVRNYTIGDVIARYQRMLGKNVLQPVGWDAFGLPAENAAVKHGVHPKEWTQKNTAKMRSQFQRLGYAYDWSRELATCDPDYYRWEQWLFTKLYEKGLVYKKESQVNWDPVDQTVLANEQVIDGKGWRSGAPVEQREISQWFIKITAYAEALLNDLDQLKAGWPEQVITMQRNWIGRSEGAEVDFKLMGHDDVISVYTTRPDTLFGVTYLALSTEHPLVKTASQHDAKLKAFIDECHHHSTMEAELATMEKLGMDTGLKAINPLNGKEIPIWTANYVLMDYGSGAVMAVPAHDERDYEFAQKYQLPIEQVIQPNDPEADLNKAAITGNGILIHSGQFDGLDNDTAKKTITQYLTDQHCGRAQVNYRLRDWGVSRQRFWGTPIPMLEDADGNHYPVPESDLPVTLPDDVILDGIGSPLAKHKGFRNVGNYQRETDTFDTFVESSWYYVRYCCPDAKAMTDERVNYWMPVDQYVGGIEHACMHLLYARLFYKLMRDLGLVQGNEPFLRLLTQGMVLKDGAKMSKSKGNTVDPEALIAQFGSDTVRLFSIFAAPPDQSLEWSDKGVEGAYRFLKKLWQYVATHRNVLAGKTTIDSSKLCATDKQARFRVHQCLKKMTDDMERLQLNTVVSGAMKIFNTLADTQDEALRAETMSILIRTLNPITPHICHALWEALGQGSAIHDAPWPQYDPAALVQDSVEMVIQVNGKVRGKIQLPANADKTTIETMALANENVQRFINGTSVRKIIVVPKKLINIVASS